MTKKPARAVAAMLAAAITAGCSDATAANNTHERSGELRPGSSYAALRVTVGDGVDSLLAGPAGSGQFFVSNPASGQVLIFQPIGEPLGDNIRFRIFTTGKDANNVSVTLAEGSLVDGTVETPPGSVVWDK